MRILSWVALVLPAAELLASTLGCGGPDAETTASSSTSSSAVGSSGSQKPPGKSVDEILADLPASCAFECGGCAEPMTPYACPTLAPWETLPHADACGAWDGKYPTPAAGKCTASDPEGEAAQKAGPIPGGVVLPDGHRVRPAGREVVFTESDLAGGFPMSILAVPGPPGAELALVSDGGIYDNALRLVDVKALASGAAPVSSYVPFHMPSSLFYGMAFLPPGGALASGGGDAMIYAFDVNPVTRALTRAPARDLPLGPSADGGLYYAGAIAATGDGARLLVAPSEHAEELLVLSLASADYGAKLATIPIDAHAIFDLRLDPADPAGATFYASDQSKLRLLEIDGKNTSPVGYRPGQRV